MKKVYILASLIMLLLTSYQIAKSYAKYVSEGVASAEKQAGAWVIKVNNKDISSKSSDKKFQIDSLTYPSNDNVLENKIAPSSSGYFDVTIDATAASVAVRFDVTIDLTALNISEAINFQAAYIVIDGVQGSSMIRTGENTYTGIIGLSDIKANKNTTARFYLNWAEDGTGQNDEADSRLGVKKEIENLNLPVSVVISQYSGETITAYQ